MATSPYFNNYSGTKVNEIKLYEDIIVESIRIMGHDIYYMPREAWETTDHLFGENLQSKFERAYLMEMYIANVQGWEGDGDFFSRHGLEIRDNTNIVVARRTFERYMPAGVTRRPREGDLLYVPVFNKIFEIKFVEEELLFYTRGYRNPYIYELRCEAFRYTHENIDTGVAPIDSIDDRNRYAIQVVVTGSGNSYNIGETVYQGASYGAATATGKVADWMPANNTLHISTVKGTFGTGTITGVSSGTTRGVANTDTSGDYTYYDSRDNKLISDEANTIISTAEINPFGNP